MKIILTILFASFVSVAGAALVRLDFKVTDNFGQPVKDATIHIKSKKKPKFIFADPGDKKMECITDSKGEASERFFYWGSDISCYITSDGYYEERVPTFALKSHYNRETRVTTILEDERLIPVVLRKRINPIPLFAQRGFGRGVSFGINEITVGFDLKCFSAIKPYGKGETIDFYVHHKVIDINGTSTCESELTFPTGGGAYIEKETSGTSHPIVYAANTNAVFITSFKRECPYDTTMNADRMGGRILNDDETLVLRTRAVLDDKGNVVSANYSKIYGPLSIGQFLIYGQSCFNPIANDTNLEFNESENLSGKKGGMFYP